MPLLPAGRLYLLTLASFQEPAALFLWISRYCPIEPLGRQVAHKYGDQWSLMVFSSETKQRKLNLHNHPNRRYGDKILLNNTYPLHGDDYMEGGLSVYCFVLDCLDDGVDVILNFMLSKGTFFLSWWTSTLIIGLPIPL
jgi:hypothetical protein